MVAATACLVVVVAIALVVVDMVAVEQILAVVGRAYMVAEPIGLAVGMVKAAGQSLAVVAFVVANPDLVEAAAFTYPS